MLKRLELVGFKSFADKTVFDFHPGITAIVGPNGSGKSNIVDAVRWIMGEQSAKSLRGGEMADVIFNGSSSRKGFGLAEVSMIFDNAKKQLATELEEVQITRRVHRDGEGEYLINGQVCRLRDIKELFLGSGAGNDAYCIIEQGKVDVLLQASTKDRRIIFEEAAGISRFKAKKIETLRKLERVDQNLSRVKDIIEEVEKQHRSVKLQASKAQRWQEYSDRLKELRLTMGRTDHRRLSERLTAEETALEAMRLELDQRAARAGACEAEAERLEMLLADLEDELREEEARLARIRQDIKARETTLTHEDALAADLETEWATTRRRTNELTGRVRTLVGAVAETAHELADITAQAEREGAVAAGLEADLQQTLGHVQSLQEEMGRDKAEHLELMRRAAHLQNDAVATRAHVDNLVRERQRLEARSSQAAESLATIDVELQELESADGALHQRLATARQDLIDKRESRERLRQDCEQKTVSIAQLRERRSGLASRIEVLEGLIRSHEGLGAGPREVFRLLETNPGWGGVLGMLADFLTVKHEHAHLIDLALGDQAQRFLVRDAAALEQALAERGAAFPGRVKLLAQQAGPRGVRSRARASRVHAGRIERQSERKPRLRVLRPQPPQAAGWRRACGARRPRGPARLLRSSRPERDAGANARPHPARA
ncbi:MAG: AAA family ATPase [Gemmataceae bacterium]